MASSKEFLENLSGSDVEFENLDEESDVSSDDSEFLSPRKKIARRLSSSESEFEDNIIRNIIDLIKFYCSYNALNLYIHVYLIPLKNSRKLGKTEQIRPVC